MGDQGLGLDSMSKRAVASPSRDEACQMASIGSLMKAAMASLNLVSDKNWRSEAEEPIQGKGGTTYETTASPSRPLRRCSEPITAASLA